MRLSLNQRNFVAVDPKDFFSKFVYEIGLIFDDETSKFCLLIQTWQEIPATAEHHRIAVHIEIAPALCRGRVKYGGSLMVLGNLTATN